jgi:4'-phosphopantetheinyl transferase
MTDVYWLEQTEEDMPVTDDWLSTNEAVFLHGMRFAKRRADWRLGRWTAKLATAIYSGMSMGREGLRRIEILPDPSGVPKVFCDNEPSSLCISLSHRAGMAICALAPSGIELGCDLEFIETRSDSFLTDYFTAEEQEWVAQFAPAARSQLLALLWSAKESALKALHAGLRLDTREVSVSVADFGLSDSGSHAWRSLQVCYKNEWIFRGWWQQTGNFVRTVVSAPPPPAPIFLKIRALESTPAIPA